MQPILSIDKPIVRWWDWYNYLHELKVALNMLDNCTNVPSSNSKAIILTHCVQLDTKLVCSALKKYFPHFWFLSFWHLNMSQMEETAGNLAMSAWPTKVTVRVIKNSSWSPEQHLKNCRPLLRSVLMTGHNFVWSSETYKYDYYAKKKPFKTRKMAHIFFHSTVNPRVEWCLLK